MVYPFICGTGNFNHQLEDDDEVSPCSTPTRSSKQRKLSSFCRSKASKNPYSDRGLEKFSALLAELEDKRQRIYTQEGAEEISFVRFAYSSSNDCKPIVVKVKEQEKAHKPPHQENIISGEASSNLGNEVNVQARNDQSGDQKVNNSKKKGLEWDFFKMDAWRRPYFYLGVVVILILVLLAVFGKSFAILCTSLGWYLVPSIKGGSSSSAKRLRKKKHYARRASEKKIVYSDGLASPTSVIAGDFSPRQQGHRKSF